MRKLRFEECWARLAKHSVFPSPNTPALLPATDALIHNYDRTLRTAAAPYEMAGQGILAQLAWSLAALETQRLTGKEREQAYNKRINELFTAPTISKDQILTRMNMVLAISDTNESLPNFKGLEAILASVTVLAWTAFEVLAADLWCATLNVRPRLAFIALDAEPIEEETDEEQARKAKAKIRLPVSLLRTPGFDFSINMGNVLRLSGKWDFARRDHASHAYTKVLPELANQLSSLFQQRSLQWLAATRNAVVHNGGLADAEFTKLVRHHPSLSTLQEGHPIPLDGGIVGDLASAAFVNSKALVAILDTWLQNNPK